MLSLLIIVCFAVDPPPTPEVLAYFAKQDEAHAAGIERLETAIADTKIAITGEPLARRKSILTATLHKQEDLLAKLNKTKERDPLFLGNYEQTNVNDIGLLKPYKIAAVVDDQTAIINNGFTTIILKTDTKDIKARTTFNSQDLWQVQAKGKPDASLSRYTQSTLSYTISPLDTKLVARQRLAYDRVPPAKP